MLSLDPAPLQAQRRTAVSPAVTLTDHPKSNAAMYVTHTKLTLSFSCDKTTSTDREAFANGCAGDACNAQGKRKLA